MTLGEPVTRVDGLLKATGAARYAAEFAPAGLVYAAITPSRIASGRTTEIDTAPALASPGVLAVLTHLNTPRLPFAEPDPLPAVYPVSGRRLRVLQDDRVLFFGQPVAVVVADTQGRAEAAAQLVEVQYAPSSRQRTDFDSEEPRPPSAAAAAKGRGQQTRQGDPDAQLRSADTVVDNGYTQPRNLHSAMEPHATVAAWDGDHLTLWEKSQWVQNVAAEMALTFGIAQEQVRVVNPFVGGAFGAALRPWPHTTLAALAARQVGRPVRLEMSRRELATAIGYRPRARHRVALGAGSDRRLVAHVHEAVSETSTFEEFADPTLSPAQTTYACADRRTGYALVRLDTNTPCPMRAPGWASGLLAQEVAMDELAWSLRTDPVELRLRNYADRNPTTGKPWAGNGLRACYARGVEAFGWAGRPQRPRSRRSGDLLLGSGMATAVYTAARYPATAAATLGVDGRVVVRCATTDMGPGTYTSMTQVASSALGIPLGAVSFELGDTALPAAMEHGGSTTMASIGSAVHEACGRLRRDLDDLAERTGRDRDDLRGLAAGGAVTATVASEPAEDFDDASHHTFGAVFVEVAVDADLGTTQVVRALGVYDAGRIVNPRLARQQCLGGMVGGIGMALYEGVAWDARLGRGMSATLADYHVPVNAGIGELQALFVDGGGDVGNPLGVKGVAELGICGVAAAVANAVWHATGVRVREFPVRIDQLVR